MRLSKKQNRLGKNMPWEKSENNNIGNTAVQAVKERNYGIDLLRILATFMVVMLHVLAQGGILKSLSTKPISGEVIWFIDILCFCAVNIFGLISGYVGLFANRKLSNILVLWLQVAFYNVLSVILVGVFWTEDFSVKYIVTNLFPILNNTNWYFTSYFVLFFFMPLVNSWVAKSEKNTLNKILLISVILFMGIESLQTVEPFGVHSGYSFVWLGLLYFIGAYIKKYKLLEKLTVKWCALGFLGCAVLTWLVRVGIELVTWKVLGAPALGTKFISYTSPVMVLQAVFALELFSKIKIKPPVIKVVSWFAPMTFGVFILHTVPAFYRYILKDAFLFVSAHSVLFIFGFSLLVVIAIFLGGSLIDWCRIRLFRLCKVPVLAQKIGDRAKKYIL